MRYPLNAFRISQGYHSGHQAIDLASPDPNNPFPITTPIFSPVTGTVIGRGEDVNYIGGKYLIVREDAPNRYEYYMGHNSTNHVSVGQRVAEGQHIANVGKTGTSVTGTHVHFQIRQFNYGALMNPVEVYNAYNPQGGGTGMNDDTARQVAYHILGRNGFDGRPNALAVGAPDLIGRADNNASHSDLFLSAESRDWRDRALPAVYGERNELRAITANQTEQINRLKADVTNANAQRDQAIEEKNQAIVEKDNAVNANTDLQNQNAVLQATVDAQAQKIKELEANPGTGDITVNFNIVGNFFWILIQKLGLK